MPAVRITPPAVSHVLSAWSEIFFSGILRCLQGSPDITMQEPSRLPPDQRTSLLLGIFAWVMTSEDADRVLASLEAAPQSSLDIKAEIRRLIREELERRASSS